MNGSTSGKGDGYYKITPIEFTNPPPKYDKEDEILERLKAIERLLRTMQKIKVEIKDE